MVQNSSQANQVKASIVVEINSSTGEGSRFGRGNDMRDSIQKNFSFSCTAVTVYLHHIALDRV